MTMSNRIAVMRQGRIEQLGTPEELYERPTTEFVAGFLGVSNLLDAEVVGRADRFADLKLLDGTVVRAPAASLNGESRVRIGIRPEKLRVLAVGDERAAAAGNANALQGTVLDASYIGVSTQYLIETGDGHKLVVYAQNLETSGASEAHPDGQRVQLTWLPQHTFVIGAAGRAASGGIQPAEEEDDPDA
jgi:spermidine/putrescine transport system ATP-binding protein